MFPFLDLQGRHMCWFRDTGTNLAQFFVHWVIYFLSPCQCLCGLWKSTTGGQPSNPFRRTVLTIVHSVKISCGKFNVRFRKPRQKLMTIFLCYENILSCVSLIYVINSIDSLVICFPAYITLIWNIYLSSSHTFRYFFAWKTKDKTSLSINTIHIVVNSSAIADN